MFLSMHLSIYHLSIHIYKHMIFGIRWQRKACVRLLQDLQNYDSLMNNLRLENVSHQKKISHIQGQRRSPSKTVGGVKSRLESNPLPTRDVQRVQTKLVHTRTWRLNRDCNRTVFECLLWRYRLVVDFHRGRGSGCSRLEYGISPLGGCCH